MAQLLSNAVQGYMANSSMIRKMFEQGILLKKQYGEDTHVVVHVEPLNR